MAHSPDRTAAAVWAAWAAGDRLAALTPDLRPADLAEGYAAQQRLGDLAGARYGWKIAATSAAGQAHIGVDRPLPGPLFARFRREPGAVLSAAALHMRVVEAEFALVLGRDLGPDPTPEQVVDAVSALHLAVEIPDSRFTGFARVGGPTLLADAACAGFFVLGPEVPRAALHDLDRRPTRIEVNGVEAGTGGGAAVLGGPLLALARLATVLHGFGAGLRAGEVVTTGTTTPPPVVGPGDEVRADFGELGEVRLSFGP
ncbi:2-keto-4-pentenoate hydratase [Pseudonocardia oroxyli]|uniref:2-keto-4-pentenoate hydratase n=1 Tax=Pseudonocardia oroxyli TaxID=366584 RepID=A0A1G7EWK0_PSEOR|nr:fumarylacetoacetate hydrolase family protein [Pseudonocardia oroxyli]SDE68039.1 2-keto-4-pentenoate hydratase [Pseudonocardia oroxyli]